MTKRALQPAGLPKPTNYSQGIEASGGVIRVRDVPQHGCVFTIDLPRHSLPDPGL